MDNDFVHDFDEVMKSLDTAEVMSIFFPTLRKALVIDTRSNETDGPMLKIMPMVASPQERLRGLRRLRPGFPRLHNLVVIPWPRYVDSLERLGVWDRLVQRFAKSGHDDIVRECDKILVELKRLEKAELAAVVLGENYHTIWSAREG
jgi:hypothetical protein